MGSLRLKPNLLQPLREHQELQKLLKRLLNLSLLKSLRLKQNLLQPLRELPELQRLSKRLLNLPKSPNLSPLRRLKLHQHPRRTQDLLEVLKNLSLLRNLNQHPREPQGVPKWLSLNLSLPRSQNLHLKEPPGVPKRLNLSL